MPPNLRNFHYPVCSCSEPGTNDDYHGCDNCDGDENDANAGNAGAAAADDSAAAADAC